MRNVIILFACLFLVLPAHAVKPISDAELADVTASVYGAALKDVHRILATPSFRTVPFASIRVVDADGLSTRVLLSELVAEPKYKIGGGVFGELRISDSLDLDESSMITTWRYWESVLAREAILDLAAKGPVTLLLSRPSRDGYSLLIDFSWAEYRMNRVRVKLDGQEAIPLTALVAAYKQRQQIENGRYIGVIANARRIAQALLGRTPRACQSLFVSRP